MKKPNLRPAPCYQEYAADMLAKREFRLMSLAERGMLWTMRMECWVNASVPASKQNLTKIFNLTESEVETALSSNVLKFFNSKNESLFCQELDFYRENLNAKSKAQSEGGSNGGKATQAKAREAKANLEAKPKPLSKEEERRNESKGEQLINKGLSPDQEEWLSGYDNKTSSKGRNYHDQSRGY